MKVPNEATALVKQGLSHLNAKQVAPAIAVLEKAIHLSPEHIDALNNLAVAYKMSGRFAEARDTFSRAITLSPGNADLHYNLGNLLKAQRDLTGSIEAYQSAIRCRPDYCAAYANMAGALLEAGSMQASIEASRRAIELNPRFPIGWENLGIALGQIGRVDEALTALRRAILLDPNSAASAYSYLGSTHAKLHNLPEALACHRHAVRLNPGHAEFQNGFALALQASGRIEDALLAFQQAIKLDPLLISAHFNLGLCQMLLGRFDEGLREYEWRLNLDTYQSARYEKPLWDGQPFPGKALLIWAEQGYGDAIQMARFLAAIKARGGAIILRCREPLKRLLGTAAGVDLVIAQQEPLPAYDLHLPIMSLMRVLDTRLSSIPAQVPYLAPSDAAKAKFEFIKSDRRGLKVGIAWRGSITGANYRNKSINLELLSRVFPEDAELAVYSLQVGDGVEELAASPKHSRLVNLASRIEDFMDTAGAIAHLDLVISVDTAVAHLAGALGKPVWTLLPYAPDWRWMLGRDDSPWYPTMRLFRQDFPGDWSGVMARMRKALGELRK